jgi:acetolactate synthase regulatory subunit
MLRSVTFDVLADADPGLLPRVLVPFARRDLTPDQMKARRLGDALQATVGLEMPAEMVNLVEGNLRQIVGVRRVEVVLRGAVRAVA